MLTTKTLRLLILFATLFFIAPRANALPAFAGIFRVDAQCFETVNTDIKLHSLLAHYGGVLPDSVAKADAAKLLAASRRKPMEMVEEMKTAAQRLHGEAMTAKDVATLDSKIAARNANALYCRKILSTMIAAQPDTYEAKAWKEMIAGPCRF